MPTSKKPTWDIFCNVIDNWGDVGVCWRLAKQLSQNGITSRLWIDDPCALSWMKSSSDPDVQIIHWTAHEPKLIPGQAFIEAFGCRAPDSFLQAAAKQHNLSKTPVWINLEYLSAQKDTEDLHGLPSLQQFGPAKGLIRWFFYPGFTAKTGGLLREPSLTKDQNLFSAPQWLKQQGIPVISNALRISLFSYPNQALPRLIEQWIENSTPIHLLATPGHTTAQIESLNLLPSSSSSFLNTTHHQNLSITRLPYLSQVDFDHLLWSCDLNMVRGEDSWIRALWANQPFIWQPYIQDDEEHHNKLDAFLALIPDAPEDWKNAQRQWNLQKPIEWSKLESALHQIKKSLTQLQCRLQKIPDLCSTLIDFVHQKSL